MAPLVFNFVYVIFGLKIKLYLIFFLIFRFVTVREVSVWILRTGVLVA